MEKIKIKYFDEDIDKIEKSAKEIGLTFVQPKQSI